MDFAIIVIIHRIDSSKWEKFPKGILDVVHKNIEFSGRNAMIEAKGLIDVM